MDWERKLRPVDVPAKFRNGPFDASFEVCGRNVMDVLDGGYGADGKLREHTLAMCVTNSGNLDEEAVERIWNGENILRKLARNALQNELQLKQKEAEGDEDVTPPEKLEDLSWQARDSAIRMGFLGLLKREGFTANAFDKVFDTSTGGDYNERIWKTMDDVYGEYQYLHHEQPD